MFNLHFLFLVLQNPNVADSPTLSRKTPTNQDIVGKQKELQALQSKIAQDQENLAVYQNKNKELLRRIEFMKRMQRTGNLDHERPPTQKAQSVDERPPPTDQAKDKLQRLHTIESIAIVKSEEDIKEHRIDPNHEKLPGDLSDVSSESSGEIVPSHVSGLETNATQLYWNEDDKGSQEEQMVVARELVKKNRQIFELEQVGGHRITGITGLARMNGVLKEIGSTCTYLKTFEDSY